MADFIERVAQLRLPKGEFVVIGSGLLGALHLRESDDIDLVVSETLFATLAHTDGYHQYEKPTGVCLVGTDSAGKEVEIWQDWGEALPFMKLLESAITIDGIFFVHPDILLDWKSKKNRPKDREDVRLLKEYLHAHSL